MRVITGSVRGRRLVAPEGYDVRPTTDKVKEAVFSAIQFDIPGCSFLDLFAGSGQMGIEALSRGALKATFVDSSKVSQSVINANIKATGFESQSQLITGDSLSFLRRTVDRFDVVFVDPPYSSNLALCSLELLRSVMNPGGIVIIESDDATKFENEYGILIKEKEYHYGKIQLTKFICRPED